MRDVESFGSFADGFLSVICSIGAFLREATQFTTHYEWAQHQGQ